MKFLFSFTALLLTFSMYAQRVINSTQNPNQNVHDRQSVNFENGAQITASGTSTYFAFIDSNTDGVPDYDVELTSNKLNFEYDEAGNQIKRFLTIVIVSHRPGDAGEEDIVYDEIAFLDEPDELNIITFDVFPNPTTGPLTIKWNNTNVKITDVQIYDLTGSLMSNISKNNRGDSNVELNISNLSTGIYMLRFVTSENEVISRKIIKK